MLRALLLTAQSVSGALGYTPLSEPVVQTATPTSGQTVTITNTTKDITLWCNPAGTLAALTIAFPSSPRIGQIVRIGCSKAVTTLTLTGGTILDAIPLFSANQLTTYQYVDVGVWAHIT